ncbi:hypothetical protein [Billgrantia endophytica]|uniref:hypothetical protein n=1 Tax=Billgrantia endophytica TaxID=2033802 RepID=UPI001055C04F|nr:hypothetical protein [Halomonas endophytica]
MKQKTKIVSASAMVASILLPTIAQAGIPITRQTQDMIFMYDNGDTVRAYSRMIASMDTNIGSIENVEKELGGDVLRTTTSHFSCPAPYNRYKSQDQWLFPNQRYARQWIGSCFDRNTVFNIEVDLAIAMEHEQATRGVYQFRDTVEIRNLSSPTGTEERQIYYTIQLDKNTYPGQGNKLGVALSPSEYTTNLYVVYENTNTVDLLDDIVSSPNAGDLVVYEMDGQTPETSSLTELERFQNDSFDTFRLDEPSEYFLYDTEGVKNVLGYASLLREQYNPDVMVVDYNNPINFRECAVAPDGSCLPESHSDPDPYFKPMVDIYTTDRTFYRNVCTGDGVTYTQNNRLEAEVEGYIERYIINEQSNISDDMSDEDLLALNRMAPYKMNSFGQVTEDFFGSHSGFPYGLNISAFDDHVTEFLGKRSSSPNNTLSPFCTGPGTYEDENCYDRWNNLHHDHYIKPLPEVEDISIVDVKYEERVMVSPATTETDSNGNEVAVPAEYEWQEKSSCDIGGTRTYNVNEFCSQSDINCTGVIRQ